MLAALEAALEGHAPTAESPATVPVPVLSLEDKTRPRLHRRALVVGQRRPAADRGSSHIRRVGTAVRGDAGASGRTRGSPAFLQSPAARRHASAARGVLDLGHPVAAVAFSPDSGTATPTSPSGRRHSRDRMARSRTTASRRMRARSSGGDWRNAATRGRPEAPASPRTASPHDECGYCPISSRRRCPQPGRADVSAARVLSSRDRTGTGTVAGLSAVGA